MDGLNKIIIRWEYMATLSGKSEREVYFNTFLLPQYDGIINYFLNKYKMQFDYDIEDIKQCIYVRLILLQSNYKRYNIINVYKYIYTVIDKEILAFRIKRQTYRDVYILRNNII
jgi:hypothetical protein